MDKEFDIFNGYLKKQGLKFTQQRQKILSCFLKTEKHVSAEEFYRLVSNLDSGIGYATVYRNLKLLRQAGLAREVDLGDRISRFEHNYGHKHHDHLICVKCGKLIEIFSPQIERLQEKLSQAAGFKATRHKMDIFGYCKRCQK